MNRYAIMSTQMMESEMMWFVVGLVAGIVFMALVDWLIDRRRK